MKCPKCGSELDTGFNCPKCKAKSYKEIVSEYNTNGEKIYEKNTIKLVQPEPTTAEMLLWLVENVKAVCIFECDFGHLGIRLELPRNKFKIFTTNDEVKNRDMLIDKAYDWAKKELKERLEVE